MIPRNATTKSIKQEMVRLRIMKSFFWLGYTAVFAMGTFWIWRHL